MEKTRKSFDITDINVLGNFDFRIRGIEGGLIYPFPTLLVSGHKGYPGFEVYIRFLETVYIACSPSFDFTFSWRMAIEEEAEKMYVIADEKRAKVYCIEEDISLYRTPLEREARKFFIVAWGIEITLTYNEVLEDRVANWGQPV